jgi:uncharacterized protein (TIGR02145 family)
MKYNRINFKSNYILAFLIVITLSYCRTGTGNSEVKKDDSTDLDSSQIIDEIKINEQVWMKKNLDVSKFQNGDTIFEVKSINEWRNAIINKQPAWAYYNFDKNLGKIYGKLYNYYSLTDPRHLAPKSWKIPTNEDFSTLSNSLGGFLVAGKKLKFSDLWADNNGKSGNGNNDSGFSGLPGGAFDSSSGSFFGLNEFGLWWILNDKDKKKPQFFILNQYNNSSSISTKDEYFDRYFLNDYFILSKERFRALDFDFLISDGYYVRGIKQ